MKTPTIRFYRCPDCRRPHQSTEVRAPLLCRCDMMTGADLLVQKLQRDLNCLSDPERSTRRRALERLPKRLLSGDPGEAAPPSPDVLQVNLRSASSFFTRACPPVLERRFRPNTCNSAYRCTKNAHGQFWLESIPCLCAGNWLKRIVTRPGKML